MILACGEGKYGPVVIVGLSHGNLDELRKGRPIKPIDLKGVIGAPATLLIYSGATELAIVNEFKRMGLLGLEYALPEDYEPHVTDYYPPAGEGGGR